MCIRDRAHTIKNLAAALEGSLFVLKQGMESGNREYLDDGWAMLEEDISRVRDKLLHLLHICLLYTSRCV